jgi:cell wall-active antibiotic response 4TMS protein YvqF
MSTPQRGGYRYGGLIWPALLIVIGAVALLVNTNVITSDRLYRLGDLWPVLVIVIGLELLVARAPMPANTAAVATILILLIAAGGSIAYVAIGPSIPGGTRTIDKSASAGKLDHGSLEVNVGGASLKIVGADIGADLFRAHIEYSGPAPDVSVNSSNGHVQISQNTGFRLFGPQRFVLSMKLSTSVRWTVVVHSGASDATYDFTSVQLQSLEDDTGASREDIALGTPKGRVPVTVNGGALTIHLHRPSGTGADVSVSGGAVSLDFDGRSQRAVGTVSASTGEASDMFAVRISGGACTVTMDTNSNQG